MPDPAALGDVADLLRGLRTVAVLGAHPDPVRPASYVPAALARRGLRVLPVNPAHAGTAQHGEPTRSTLAELREPVDAVVVFRRPDQLEGHLTDLLAMAPRPPAVWLQQGIRSEPFAARLRSEGFRVVQDRCIMVDLDRLERP